jgi:hypothetical protein
MASKIQGIKFSLNEQLYLRDPQNTEFGQRLLSNSILLMDEIGFESFTFRKLATRMSSAEASIYRYFENKHKLLIYLSCWYWEWVNYLIDINIRNVEDPRKKLSIVIHTVIYASEESNLTEYINEHVLHRIIIREGSKSYHIHNVDSENQKGFFLSYKNLTQKVAGIILEVNPAFQYSKSLASNLFEMSNNQIYFAEHLPRLTDIRDSDNILADLEKMLVFFTFKILNA